MWFFLYTKTLPYITTAWPIKTRKWTRIHTIIESSESNQVFPITAIVSFVSKRSSLESLAFSYVCLVSSSLIEQLHNFSLTFMTLTVWKTRDVAECPSINVCPFPHDHIQAIHVKQEYCILFLASYQNSLFWFVPSWMMFTLIAWLRWCPPDLSTVDFPLSY